MVGYDFSDRVTIGATIHNLWMIDRPKGASFGSQNAIVLKIGEDARSLSQIVYLAI
jgi:hypothetical protein